MLDKCSNKTLQKISKYIFAIRKAIYVNVLPTFFNVSFHNTKIYFIKHRPLIFLKSDELGCKIEHKAGHSK